MRAPMKSIEITQNGTPLTLRFAGEPMLLDPAGVLFASSFKTLIVADLHLEKGASYARRGQFLPPYDTAATLTRLSVLISKYAPEIVIFLGDSFHDDEAHGRLDEASIDAICTLAKDRHLIWVTGNHDPSPPDGLPGDCASEIAIGSIILRHIPKAGETSFEIAGHLHPSAQIIARGRKVRRACFAADNTRIIMPSFGVLTGGLDLSHGAFKGLFHHETLRAYMLGSDKIYPIASCNIVGL